MLSAKLRRNPGRIRAIVYAVLVHAAVIGLAVIGFRWSMAPSTEPVVQAVVVPEQAARKPEAADNRRAQEEEEARKKAEAEKRRQAELKKKQEEEQAQQRLITERRKKEVAEKEKQKRAAELERKNEAKRRQKLTEQSLQEQLAAEEKQRTDVARAARAATVVDKYKALIRQRVSRSWNRPVGVAKGLKCVVRVRLTPAGEVLSADVVGRSGNEIFDRSVENAVFKAAPLPLPEDPTLFDNFREIEFLFSPEE
ncbi:MAG: cell envelope integrity protein TolA [Gammaproteobacteria bacterium]|nr:cell envelope integrity protein TolA [Gammaproteobacteria bacterium]